MNDYSQYIDDYISGTLSQEEMERFESRKENNPELESEYQILLKSREFLKARSMLHEVENDPDLPLAENMVKEYYEEERIELLRKSRLRRGLYITIPIAAVLAGIVFLILHLYNTDPLSRIYSQYYTPLQADEIQNIIVRDGADRFLLVGLEYYTEGNYPLAIEKLLQAEKSNYFLGLSYMGMKEYYKAQMRLEGAFRDNSYHPGVNWYLGLTYLKLSKPHKAIIHFKRLFLMENAYQISASRIIRKLEKYNAAEGN